MEGEHGGFLGMIVVPEVYQTFLIDGSDLLTDVVARLDRAIQ
jgi:hypothetical protein